MSHLVHDRDGLVAYVAVVTLALQLDSTYSKNALRAKRKSFTRNGNVTCVRATFTIESAVIFGAALVAGVLVAVVM
jgi:hypothetical protein